MSTFIGHIEGKRDEKGRIFVPATYRRILGERGTVRLVMRRDADNTCLVFYPEEVWNEQVSTLRAALDEWNPSDQMLLMQYMSDAEFMEMDAQGRILLSKRVLEQVSIEQGVLFVGMLDRFALWSPALYERQCLDARDLSLQLRRRIAEAKNDHTL